MKVYKQLIVDVDDINYDGCLYFCMKEYDAKHYIGYLLRYKQQIQPSLSIRVFTKRYVENIKYFEEIYLHQDLLNHFSSFVEYKAKKNHWEKLDTYQFLIK